jgi:hypothetical protein
MTQLFQPQFKEPTLSARAGADGAFEGDEEAALLLVRADYVG